MANNLPVFTEDRVVQHNLLQEFNEFVRQVSGHEGLDCDGHLLGVLSLRQSSLHHLQKENETRVKNISNMKQLKDQCIKRRTDV